MSKDVDALLQELLGTDLGVVASPPQQSQTAVSSVPEEADDYLDALLYELRSSEHQQQHSAVNASSLRHEVPGTSLGGFGHELSAVGFQVPRTSSSHAGYGVPDATAGGSGFGASRTSLSGLGYGVSKMSVSGSSYDSPRTRAGGADHGVPSQLQGTAAFEVLRKSSSGLGYQASADVTGSENNETAASSSHLRQSSSSAVFNDKGLSESLNLQAHAHDSDSSLRLGVMSALLGGSGAPSALHLPENQPEGNDRKHHIPHYASPPVGASNHLAGPTSLGVTGTDPSQGGYGTATSFVSESFAGNDQRLPLVQSTASDLTSVPVSHLDVPPQATLVPEVHGATGASSQLEPTIYTSTNPLPESLGYMVSGTISNGGGVAPGAAAVTGGAAIREPALMTNHTTAADDDDDNTGVGAAAATESELIGSDDEFDVLEDLAQVLSDGLGSMQLANSIPMDSSLQDVVHAPPYAAALPQSAPVRVGTTLSPADLPQASKQDFSKATAEGTAEARHSPAAMPASQPEAAQVFVSSQPTISESCAEPSVPVEPPHPMSRHERMLWRVAAESAAAFDADHHNYGDPRTVLEEVIRSSQQSWSQLGRPDSAGCIVGGALKLRLEDLGGGGTGTLGELMRGRSTLGEVQTIALRDNLLALATSRGLLMLATLHPPSVPPPPPLMALPPPPQPPPPVPLAFLGDLQPGEGAATTLAFTPVGMPADMVWLAVGQPSGNSVVWDVGRKPPRVVCTIASHNLPVVAAAFLPSRQSPLLLTADRRGKLLVHAFVNMLLRTSVTSRVLLDSSMPISSIVPLIPFNVAGREVGNGIFALCSASAVNICRLVTGGGAPPQLITLYTLKPPAESAPNTLCLAAWLPHHLPSASPGALTRMYMGQVPVATLAVAWGSQVVFHSIPLLGDHTLQPTTLTPTGQRKPIPKGVRAAAAPVAADSPERLRASSVPTLVEGFPVSTTAVWDCAWEEMGDVLSIHWCDPNTLSAIAAHGGSSIALLLNASTGTPLERLSFPGSPAHLPPEVWSGVNWAREPTVSSLIGWGSRLVLSLAGGLLLSVRALAWEERLATAASASFWRLGLSMALEVRDQMIARRADVSNVDAWLMALAAGDAQNTLLDGPPTGHEASARLCTSLCLATDHIGLLWSSFFPLFQSCGATSAFLAALEPALLSGRLASAPPEVVRALVESWAGSGMTRRIERAIAHLDVSQLDLDQVLRLCETHHLYGSVITIYNRVGDYLRPMLDLLAAAAGVGSSRGPDPNAAYKLLVYVRCIFGGEAFPPGTGPLPLDAGPLEEVRASLIGRLLYSSARGLAKDWGRAPADVAGKLREPYPALQILLNVDVPATMFVLGACLKGWDVVDSDLRAGAGQPEEEMERVVTASQAIVDALVVLLESGRFGSAMRGPPGAGNRSPSAGATGHSAAHDNLAVHSGHAERISEGLAAVLDFIGGLTSSGRVFVQPPVVLQLAHHLTLIAIKARAAGDTAAVDAAEDTLCGIVSAAAQDDSAPGKLNNSESNAVLALAREAALPRVVSTLLTAQKDYAGALSALMHDSAPGKALDYVNRFMAGPPTEAGAAAMFAALGKHVVGLMMGDAASSTSLLVNHFPLHLIDVLRLLEETPEAHFKYLRAAVKMREQYEAGSRRSSIAGTSTSVHPTALPPAAVNALYALTSPPNLDAYVRLLCRFSPTNVLPFLMRHAEYDVRYAVGVCEAAGVHDAAALLHERMGDRGAALRLVLADLGARFNEMEAAVASALPPLSEDAAADNGDPTTPEQGAKLEGQAGSVASAGNMSNVTWLMSYLPSINCFRPGSLAGVDSKTEASVSRAGAQEAAASTGGPEPHLAWLAGLSPRIALVLPRVVSGGLGGTDGRWVAPVISPGSSAIPSPPSQLGSAWKSLNGATSFCQRAAQITAADVEQAQHAWMSLMQVCVERLRMHAPSDHPLHLASTPLTLSGIKSGDIDDSQGEDNLEPCSSVQDAALHGSPRSNLRVHAALRHIYSAFLEEVVGCMADHVALTFIVHHISHEYGSDALHLFRPLLLGVFGAAAYEAAMVGTACRLVATDVTGRLRALRRARAGAQTLQLPAEIRQAQTQQLPQSVLYNLPLPTTAPLSDPLAAAMKASTLSSSSIDNPAETAAAVLELTAAPATAPTVLPRGLYASKAAHTPLGYRRPPTHSINLRSSLGDEFFGFGSVPIMPTSMAH